MEIFSNSTAVLANATAETESDELFVGYNLNLLKIASIVCMIFMGTGIPGNLITIIALARCKKLRNATAVFIINLSCSDLLFCCFNLPLAASTFWNRKWLYGDLLCRLFPLLRYGLVAVSLFNILAITINRYIMIGHPRIYQRVYKRKYISVMVVLSWMLGFVALIPTWFNSWGRFGLDKSIGSCTILLDHNQHSPKEFLFVIAFALPCLCIVICYARIFYIVRRTAMKTQEPIGGSVRVLNDNNRRRESMAQANVTMEHEKTSSTKEKESEVIEEEPLEDKPKERRLSFNILPDDNTKESTVIHIDPEMQAEETSLVVADQESEAVEKNKVNQKNIDKLRYIDTSFESDFPPTLSELKHYNIEKTTVLIATTTIDILESNHTNGDLGKKDSIETEEVILETLNQDIEKGANNETTGNLNANGTTATATNRRKKRSIVSRIGQSTLLRKSKSNRSLHHRNTSGASIMYSGRMTTKDRRLLKMILVIFLAFVICYLPITLSKIFDIFTRNNVLNIMGYLLIYFTTCINPIIYVVMSYEYRQAYWNLLMCRTNSYRGNNKDMRPRGSLKN